MTADYHLHTALCRHADGHPVDYVRAAAKLGLPEIGFADHAPTPEPLDDWRMAWDEFPRYVDWIERARQTGDTLGVPVRLGLECDFLPGREHWVETTEKRAAFDYLIGSVHYVDSGWSIDDPRYVGRLGEMDQDDLWSRYWKIYTSMIKSEMFDIYAHADLPKKFGFIASGDLRRFYEPAIAAAADRSGVFEINTAGLRKPVNETYPNLGFLQMACEAGVGLVISSDAHAPDEVGAEFKTAVGLAREAGYRDTVRFRKRAKKTVSLG